MIHTVTINLLEQAKQALGDKRSQVVGSVIQKLENLRKSPPPITPPNTHTPNAAGHFIGSQTQHHPGETLILSVGPQWLRHSMSSTCHPGWFSGLDTTPIQACSNVSATNRDSLANSAENSSTSTPSLLPGQ